MKILLQHCLPCCYHLQSMCNHDKSFTFYVHNTKALSMFDRLTVSSGRHASSQPLKLTVHTWLNTRCVNLSETVYDICAERLMP